MLRNISIDGSRMIRNEDPSKSRQQVNGVRNKEDSIGEPRRSLPHYTDPLISTPSHNEHANYTPIDPRSASIAPDLARPSSIKAFRRSLRVPHRRREQSLEQGPQGTRSKPVSSTRLSSARRETRREMSSRRGAAPSDLSLAGLYKTSRIPQETGISRAQAWENSCQSVTS